MYIWIRCATSIWPRTDFRSSVSKAIAEQFTVDPALICTFLFVMSLLESGNIVEAKNEVSHSVHELNIESNILPYLTDNELPIYLKVFGKFIDTYKVGVIYWPTMQTLNFSFVPVKNQVVCTSFFSMIWSAFLAYMKHQQIQTKNTQD